MSCNVIDCNIVTGYKPFGKGFVKPAVNVHTAAVVLVVTSNRVCFFLFHLSNGKDCMVCFV